MTEPRKTTVPADAGADWERMAMQLEGRLDDGAGYLDGLSDEDLAVFAEAAAVTRELEAEDEAAVPPHRADEDEAVPGVLPLRRPARPSPWLDRRWMAAAAVVAAVALVPLATRGMRGGAVRSPPEAVAMLENPAAGLPVGWDEDRPESRTRGEGGPMTDEGRAARIATRIVDLEVAIRAGNADQTRLLASQVAVLLNDVPAAGAAASQFRGIAGQAGGAPAALAAEAESASRNAAGLLDEDRFALGAWGEAARLAAVRQDAGFFRGARTRRTLAKAEGALADDEEARTALTAVRAYVDGDAHDWPALRNAVDGLLRAIT